MRALYPGGARSVIGGRCAASGSSSTAARATRTAAGCALSRGVDGSGRSVRPAQACRRPRIHQSRGCPRRRAHPRRQVRASGSGRPESAARRRARRAGAATATGGSASPPSARRLVSTRARSRRRACRPRRADLEVARPSVTRAVDVARLGDALLGNVAGDVDDGRDDALRQAGAVAQDGDARTVAGEQAVGGVLRGRARQRRAHPGCADGRWRTACPGRPVRVASSDSRAQQ